MKIRILKEIIEDRAIYRAFIFGLIIGSLITGITMITMIQIFPN